MQLCARSRLNQPKMDRSYQSTLRSRAPTLMLPAEEPTSSTSAEDAGHTLFSPGVHTPGHSFHSISMFKVCTEASAFLLPHEQLMHAVVVGLAGSTQHRDHVCGRPKHQSGAHVCSASFALSTGHQPQRSASTVWVSGLHAQGGQALNTCGFSQGPHGVEA